MFLEENAIRGFWPPLVKSVEVCSEYPGYKYTYFETFAELDEYFTKECGENWSKQEWAKYWFNQHKASKRAASREVAILTGRADANKAFGTIDKNEIKSLMRSFIAQSKKNPSIRQIQKFLRTKQYYMSTRTIWNYRNEINEEDTLKADANEIAIANHGDLQ